MGSPGTLALGTIGSVGSQSPAHWPPLPGGALGEPGAAGSQRSPEGPDVDAARGPAPGPPADADQLRAASSLAWAALRSSARRLTSCCCSPNLRCTSVSSATAAFWLDWASATALSAFCLANRAADSLFTCSVRARCKLSITCRELAARVWPAAAVAMTSSGLAVEVAVRRAVDVTGHREAVESLLGGRDCSVGILDRLLAGLDVMLSGRRVVACGFYVDQSLVDAFLLGLNLRAEVLQMLIGLGYIGDQFGHRVRPAPGSAFASPGIHNITATLSMAGARRRLSLVASRKDEPRQLRLIRLGLLWLNAGGRRRPQ